VVYAQLCEIVFQIVLWVEVGFEGFDHFAVSPASKSWRSGFYQTEQERVADLRSKGKAIYNQFMTDFVSLRDRTKSRGDVFETYGYENLLEKWKTPAQV
jgi:hypothetical protein